MSAEMETYNVTLSLDRGSASDAVRATWSAVDELPVRDKQEGQLSLALQEELLQLGSHTLAAYREHTPEKFVAECRRLGTLLWQEIIHGQIEHCYRAAFQKARNGNRKLRIRLQLSPEWEHLPYELLYDSEHNFHLGANTFIS